jgi:hypothetical protein
MLYYAELCQPTDSSFSQSPIGNDVFKQVTVSGTNFRDRLFPAFERARSVRFAAVMAG